MPQLIKMYIRHVFIGFGIAIAFVGMLFYFDIGNLWTLVSNAKEGWLAALMLVVFNGIVFSGVQFGIAVMRLGTDEDETKGPRGSTVRTEMLPVRVDEMPNSNAYRSR